MTMDTGKTLMDFLQHWNPRSNHHNMSL